MNETIFPKILESLEEGDVYRLFCYLSYINQHPFCGTSVLQMLCVFLAQLFGEGATFDYDNSQKVLWFRVSISPDNPSLVLQLSLHGEASSNFEIITSGTVIKVGAGEALAQFAKLFRLRGLAALRNGHFQTLASADYPRPAEVVSSYEALVGRRTVYQFEERAAQIAAAEEAVFLEQIISIRSKSDLARYCWLWSHRKRIYLYLSEVRREAESALE